MTCTCKICIREGEKTIGNPNSCIQSDLPKLSPEQKAFSIRQANSSTAICIWACKSSSWNMCKAKSTNIPGSCWFILGSCFFWMGQWRKSLLSLTNIYLKAVNSVILTTTIWPPPKDCNRCDCCCSHQLLSCDFFGKTVSTQMCSMIAGFLLDWLGPSWAYDELLLHVLGSCMGKWHPPFIAFTCSLKRFENPILPTQMWPMRFRFPGNSLCDIVQLRPRLAWRRVAQFPTM